MSNAKSVKPKSIEIMIEGKPYVIRFTLNSFIELEEIYGDVESAMKSLSGEVVKDEVTGMTVMEPLKDDNGKVILDENDDEKTTEKRKVSFSAVRNMLYAGLISAQPNITKTDVGNFEFSDFSQIMAKLMEALTGSLPESKEEIVKN